MNTPNKQAELEKEIKEVEEYCPKERTDGGNWNRLDILNAELKGIKEGKQINKDIVIKSKEAFDNLYRSCLEEREQIENNAKAQAISGFKEKLKKELFSEALERDMNINDSSLDRLSCDYINKIIEKTAKEMK